MIRLVYSNRTEELVAELAARVRAQQLNDGVLAAVPLVVPSMAVDDYLRLGIARECGVAANLDMTLITRFAAGEMARRGAPRIAGADAIDAMALTLLLDDSFVAEPELEPVRSYLSAVASAEAADVRRVQLASRIGRLFEEYTYSRPQLLGAWARGPTMSGGPYAEPERWQRRMWLAMFGEAGLAGARALTPLHEATAALGAASPVDAGGRLAAAVHVFGFAHFARTFHDFLLRLARAREVVIYSLTPCEGFWEDYDPSDAAPLQLWGRPGREHVRALNAVAGFEHDDRFVEPSGATLLAQLQRDLLRREPARERVDPRFAFDRDESIVVLEHASVRRELEAVASEIWRLVERDPTLRFDEIAVLVPEADAQAYLAHLPAVFREAHQIPHHALDLPLSGERRIVEAVELLVSLPLGRFTRQEVLGLALHPAVVASLDDVESGRWLAWCDALGVVHGADRLDHEDTYIERDILNWDQALRRLALGAFMTGDASGERRPFELGAEAYVPLEVAASDLRDSGGLGLLVRSLVADARFMKTAELSMTQWASLLVDLVGTYVTPTNDTEAESLVQCLRRLNALNEIDIGERRASYRLACELARGRLAVMPRGRGAEGVVVSRIGSVRAIPFRAVFACGMGEGRFPSGEAEDALDLRWSARLPGDVTPRERDKYAFLELLLATRDRLYLSYVSRDPLTGDALAPSSVIEELLHTLRRGYRRDQPGTSSGPRRRHPLRRWDPSYFPDLFPPVVATARGSADIAGLGTMCLPEARAEARALAARRALEESGARVEREALAARVASDPAWAVLGEHLRLGRVPDRAAGADARAVVPMYALVKFLEFPLQGWARFRVGLDEFDEEDSLGREDEPFETDVRDETLLLRAVFLAAAKGVALAQVYDETVRERELRGSGPSGVFVDAERGEHMQTLDAWTDGLRALEIPLETIEVHRFGRAGEHAAADGVHPPLTFEVDVDDPGGVTRIVRAEIGGRTLPFGGAGASITLHRRLKENKDEWALADRQRAHLRAFIDHAVLSATGVSDGRGRASALVVATPQGFFSERVLFEPISRGHALVWLRDLVRELLGGPHAYFFPCEALFVHRRREGGNGLAGLLEEARDMLRDSDGPPLLRSAYGPVPRPAEYPLPTAAEASAMMARRFGVFFDKCRSER